MTQDEIIEMARFAGIRIDSFGFQGGFIEEFKAFAKLVATKEREACALICDDQALGAYWEGADACADRIRARGEA
jgi:hypothetical protein